MGIVINMADRRRRTFEDSAAHSDLSMWGFWKGLQLAADGYSPMNTLTHILSGRGEKPGHKILCLDMKPRAWEVNARVFSLERELIDVLVARYCLPVNPNGQPYRTTDIAPYLGITSSLFDERLNRARERYKALIFPQPLYLHAG